MEDHTMTPSSSLPDSYLFCIPSPPHGTSEMNGDSISPGQSPSFGYIPIGLDIDIEESLQDGDFPPVSDADFSYQSWVDEAWNVDKEALSTLGSTSENYHVEMRDSSEKSSFTPIHERLSLPGEPSGFEDAFGSFCNVSPLDFDSFSSSSRESTRKVESKNECSGFAPNCGGDSSSKSLDESSEKAKNRRDTKQYNDKSPPDIVVIESQGDQGAKPSQSLPDVGGAIAQNASLVQPGSMAKPFLENPIQFHFCDSGKVEFLVRLSLNEVQTQMPMWLDLYWEKLKVLERQSTISGSRASLPKRRRGTRT
jgi:hypothetical protein